MSKQLGRFVNLAKWRRSGAYLSLMLILIFSFQNCGPKLTAGEDSFVVENSNLSSQARMMTSCVFNGELLAEGQKVTAYLLSSADHGSTCQSEVRECKDGQLSGNYAYRSCVVGEGAWCLFNGLSIPDGGSIRAFLNSTVKYGGSCQSQERFCKNGILDGQYNSSSCGIAVGKTCKFNGRDLANGDSVKASETSSVPFGKKCKNQMRECQDGILSGSGQFESCAEGVPLACLFNGQVIPHDGEVTAYKDSAVPSSETCQSQKRVCTNGVLDKKFQYANCERGKPKGCIFDGLTKANGEKFNGFDSRLNKQGILFCKGSPRACDNGTVTGDSSFKLSSSSCNK